MGKLPEVVRRVQKVFVRTEKKNRLKIKSLGRMLLGPQGTTRRDIPDPGPGISRTKTLCKAPFSVILNREWAGMSRDLGRDVPGSEKMYARKL